MTTTFLYGHR